MRSGYMQCVPVISANIPCMYYVHRDIYMDPISPPPKYILVCANYIQPQQLYIEAL